MRPHLRELVVPPIVLALGAGVAALGVSLGRTSRTETTVTVSVPAPMPEVPAEMREQAAAIEPAVNGREHEVLMVFSVGADTYVKLGDAAAPAPKHGKPVHVTTDDGLEASVAKVAAKHLPASLAAWQGRTVVLDDGCEAKVTGFAYVGRLVGSPGYASSGDGKDVEEWTAANVLELGAPIVAGRLDGCTGSYARDRELPAIVVPEAITDENLGEAARAQLVASGAAQETESEWMGYDERPASVEDGASYEVQVVRHPRTGVTWVSAHLARYDGCGGLNVNLWGLFRVARDQSLSPVVLKKMDAEWSPVGLLDVDNDGALEVHAKPWTMHRSIVRTDGEDLATDSIQFYGCGC